MVEGGGSKTMAKTKEWLSNYPKEVHKLLKLLTRVIINYLVMQVIRVYCNNNEMIFENYICAIVHMILSVDLIEGSFIYYIMVSLIYIYS